MNKLNKPLNSPFELKVLHILGPYFTEQHFSKILFFLRKQFAECFDRNITPIVVPGAPTNTTKDIVTFISSRHFDFDLLDQITDGFNAFLSFCPQLTHLDEDSYRERIEKAKKILKKELTDQFASLRESGNEPDEPSLLLYQRHVDAFGERMFSWVIKEVVSAVAKEFGNKKLFTITPEHCIKIDFESSPAKIDFKESARLFKRQQALMPAADVLFVAGSVGFTVIDNLPVYVSLGQAGSGVTAGVVGNIMSSGGTVLFKPKRKQYLSGSYTEDYMLTIRKYHDTHISIDVIGG